MRPFVSALFVGAALLTGLLLGGCGFDCDCPPPQIFRVQGGAYQPQGDASVVAPDGGTPLPHGNEPTTMTIDRDAGVVTFTRQLPTGVVVERWRIRTAVTQ
jgi:hypothetical protein